MKAKRFISILLTIAMLAALTTGCGSKSTASEATSEAASAGAEAKTTETAETAEAQEPITLKLAVESAVGTPGEMSGQKFKEMVEEQSNGSILIDYYPVGQLGTGDALTEQLQTGSVDMSWRAIEWYSNFEPGWNILLMGFLFKDRDQLEAFLSSDKQTEFKANLLQNANLRMIADNGIGSPRVLISKEPVNSPEDMAGMNMRVPGIEMYLKTWQGIGVNCVSIPWGESYMALSQGTADALESPLGSIYGMKFYEVAKYVTLTNHIYSPYVMVINENSYQKLSDAQKEIIDSCAIETGRLFTTYDAEAVAKNVELMKDDGVTFNATPDIQAFQAKLGDVAAECEKDGLWPAGLYDYVQGLQ
jgi:tripartite ATP-independent transporter DctP family solute receptor